MDSQSIIDILDHFDIPREAFSPEICSNGLINKSYVIYNHKHNARYFLQQVDHNIFMNIGGLMNNISVVASYFNSIKDPPAFLNLFRTRSGDNFLKTADGNYYRLYNHVDGNTYFRARDEAMAGEAGKAYGEFLGKLSGLQSDQLVETIPQFHDIDLRYEQFRDSLEKANSERKAKASELISRVEVHYQTLSDYFNALNETCPKRATHNDTKLSNLLFDKDEKALIVIDYDTLMPGYLPLDFGDAVRTICSMTVEDDPELTMAKFDLNLIRVFSRSFLGGCRHEIELAEIQNLAMAVAYMPFLMGLRMLTDYLNNDIYYTIKYSDHNYHRAANQLTLFMSGLSLQNEITNIVTKPI